MTGIQVIGLLGATIVLCTFVLYNRGIEKITTGPWLLWAVGDGFDFLTYDAMTTGDAVNYVPLAFMVGSIVTFVIAFCRGRFSCPDKVEWFVIAIDLMITIPWWSNLASASLTNVLLQFSTVLSFGLMYRALLKGREQETRGPWIGWSAGNACFLLVACLSTHDLVDLAYPVVALVTHLLVLWCIRAAAKRGVSA